MLDYPSSLKTICRQTCPYYMNKAKPLVSIILPIRNVDKLLSDCLKSLVSQTYKNIEIIAVDDKSSDKTRKILNSLRQRYKNIKIIKNKKQYGMAISLNRAIKKARGDFLAFMNPADLCKKQRIKKQVEFLLTNPKVVVVGTQAIFLNKKNKTCGKFLLPQDHDNICQTLVSGDSLLFESAMINTMLLPKDAIRFEKNTYPLIFSEMFVKLLSYGQFINLKNFLYYRRVNKNSNLWQKIIQYPSIIKLLLKSLTLYDYHPSLWSFFLPLKTLIRH